MVDINRIDKITSRQIGKNKEVYYSDFFTNLNVHPATDDVVRLTNEEAAKRAIRNILATDTNERFFNPTFGSDLDTLLFEPMTAVTANLIETKIREAIGKHEPRVNILQVVVNPIETKNAYDVTLVFEVINSINPTSISLTLYRVR